MSSVQAIPRNLFPLPRDQAEKTQFPPSCVVVYRPNKNIQGILATVTSVCIELQRSSVAVTRRFYNLSVKIYSTAAVQSIPECDLCFARGCPVYLSKQESFEDTSEEDWMQGIVLESHDNKGYEVSFLGREWIFPRERVKFRKIFIMPISTLLPHDEAQKNIFPPSCPIIYHNKNTEDNPILGKVTSVRVEDFQHFYEIFTWETSLMKGRSIPECNLHFAPGCPVFITKSESFQKDPCEENWLEGVVVKSTDEGEYSVAFLGQEWLFPLTRVKFRSKIITQQCGISNEFQHERKNEGLQSIVADDPISLMNTGYNLSKYSEVTIDNALEVSPDKRAFLDDEEKRSYLKNVEGVVEVMTKDKAVGSQNKCTLNDPSNKKGNVPISTTSTDCNLIDNSETTSNFVGVKPHATTSNRNDVRGRESDFMDTDYDAEVSIKLNEKLQALNGLSSIKGNDPTPFMNYGFNSSKTSAAAAKSSGENVTITKSNVNAFNADTKNNVDLLRSVTKSNDKHDFDNPSKDEDNPISSFDNNFMSSDIPEDTINCTGENSPCTNLLTKDLKRSKSMHVHRKSNISGDRLLYDFSMKDASISHRVHEIASNEFDKIRPNTFIGRPKIPFPESITYAQRNVNLDYSTQPISPSCPKNLNVRPSLIDKRWEGPHIRANNPLRSHPNIPLKSSPNNPISYLPKDFSLTPTMNRNIDSQERSLLSSHNVSNLEWDNLQGDKAYPSTRGNESPRIPKKKFESTEPCTVKNQLSNTIPSPQHTSSGNYTVSNDTSRIINNHRHVIYLPNFMSIYGVTKHILGTGGKRIRSLNIETGCKIVLRGKGSSYKRDVSDREFLHIIIKGRIEKNIQKTRIILEDLILEFLDDSQKYRVLYFLGALPCAHENNDFRVLTTEKKQGETFLQRTLEYPYKRVWMNIIYIPKNFTTCQNSDFMTGLNGGKLEELEFFTNSKIRVFFGNGSYPKLDRNYVSICSEEKLMVEKAIDLVHSMIPNNKSPSSQRKRGKSKRKFSVAD